MPELPEVEQFGCIARSVVLGQRIKQVLVRPDPIVFGGLSAQDLESALVGRTVQAVCRRGKHLWFELDQRPWPLFHFGMTGSFRALKADDERLKFWKLELITPHGQRLVMPDARRLGRVRLRDDPLTTEPLSKLGFDPLASPITKKQFIALLADRQRPIKALLLDQHVVAGVGNWIADEVLYQSRIDPHRWAGSLSDTEAGRVYQVLRRVLKRAVAVGADSERFPKSWLFHRRWGKNVEAVTHDGRPLAFSTVGGRTTAWVPELQT